MDSQNETQTIDCYLNQILCQLLNKSTDNNVKKIDNVVCIMTNNKSSTLLEYASGSDDELLINEICSYYIKNNISINIDNNLLSNNTYCDICLVISLSTANNSDNIKILNEYYKSHPEYIPAKISIRMLNKINSQILVNYMFDTNFIIFDWIKKDNHLSNLIYAQIKNNNIQFLSKMIDNSTISNTIDLDDVATKLNDKLIVDYIYHDQNMELLETLLIYCQKNIIKFNLAANIIQINDDLHHNIFIESIIDNNINFVNVMLKYDNHIINVPDTNMNTPLYNAIMCDQVELVAILLDNPTINIDIESIKLSMLKDNKFILTLLLDNAKFDVNNIVIEDEPLLSFAFANNFNSVDTLMSHRTADISLCINQNLATLTTYVMSYATKNTIIILLDKLKNDIVSLQKWYDTIYDIYYDDDYRGWLNTNKIFKMEDIMYTIYSHDNVCANQCIVNNLSHVLQFIKYADTQSIIKKYIFLVNKVYTNLNESERSMFYMLYVYRTMQYICSLPKNYTPIDMFESMFKDSVWFFFNDSIMNCVISNKWYNIKNMAYMKLISIDHKIGRISDIISIIANYV